jgi:hypothetical protein
MLPSLAGIVPMETKLRQDTSNVFGLLIRELNPNPLADDLGHGKEARRVIVEQLQQFLGRERAIISPQGEIDLRKVSRAQGFGTAQES